MTKPILNPSRLADLCKCLFKYYLKYVRDLTTTDNFAHKREFGTYVHVAEAAYDESKDVKKSLELQTRKFKREPWYNVKLSGALTQLEREALALHNGTTFKNAKGAPTDVESYQTWSAKNLPKSAVVDVEKRLWADIGPVILAPKLDLVVETTGWFPDSPGTDLWVVERKSTERWQDTTWEQRWQLDGQTTLQLIAAEKAYDREFTGVMVEPIQITRQSRKDVADPQPIGKAQRLIMKWTRKPPQVVAAMEVLLEGLPGELHRRTELNDWPTNGMLNGACDWCGLKKFCRGEITSDLLTQRAPDEIDERLKKGKK